MSTAPAGHTPFAIWNRTGNQVVRGLIGSPLHPLVSGRMALITVTGRRSGRRHTLPVGYQRKGETLEIPVLWAERKLWWRNLGDGAPVVVRLRGADRGGTGRAEVADDGSVKVLVDLDPS